MNPAEFGNIVRTERDHWWYRGMREILFRMLDPVVASRPSVNRCLEAGCGTGYFSAVLQERYRWPVTPVDLEWEGLTHARRIGLNALAQADIAALPFVSASFDAVVSMDVLVHFPPGKESVPFAEMSRVLTPGGLMVLRVAAFDLLRSRHSMFVEERQRYTRRRLLNLARRHGIQPRCISYANCLLAPIALAKFRLWEPLFSPKPESGVEPVAGWLNWLLHAPLAAEAALLGSGVTFPFGQSVVLIGVKAVR